MTIEQFEHLLCSMDHSSPPLPPLDALRAFEAAARLGSFSAAANDLHLTHGAISRQVAKLEHWLGEKLFERQARGVALTPQGQRLHQRTSEAFALIADSSDRWIERRGAAVVRLTLIPSVSSLWLMPRLKLVRERRSAFADRVRGRASQHRSRSGGDRPGDPLRPRQPAGTGLRPPVRGAAAFRSPHPPSPNALGSGEPERILRLPARARLGCFGWRAWFAAQGMDYRPRPQDRRFEDYNLVLDAAAHGLGVALARPPLVGEALRSGRLVAVDTRTALNPVAYWLDRPATRLRPSAAVLARRIMAEAGLAAASAEIFLKT